MASALNLVCAVLALAVIPRPAPRGALPVPPGMLNTSACGPIGSPERWASLSDRLSRGAPATIFAIGSSLVGVHGGCTAPAPALQSRECIMRCPRCCGSRCGVWGAQGGWALRFFHWLNESYPVRAEFERGAPPDDATSERPGAPAPPLGHRLYNLGEPGGNLVPAIVACPRTYLGASAPDLVLLDPHTAGLHGRNGQSQVERLTRMLLAAPSRPLVLVVHFAKLPFAQRTGAPSEPLPGHDSVVDRAAKALVGHYGLPSLDIAGCFMHALERGVPFATRRYAPTDGLHPSADGSWLIAEGLIALVERGLAQADARPAAVASARVAPLPAPLHAQPSRVGLSCYSFDRAGYDAAIKTKPRVVGDRAKPQSIAGEGYGQAGVVPAILPYSRGWRFVERELKSATPYKPGLVAETAGALLALALEIPRRAVAHVGVDVLRSWEGHGVARLSCRGGCACEAIAIDAHRRGSNTSTLENVQVRVHPLSRRRGSKPSALEHAQGRGGNTSALENAHARAQPLGRRRAARALRDRADGDDAVVNGSSSLLSSGFTATAPAGACVLHLEVLNETSSGAHRFKLARVVVEADFDPRNATAVSPLGRRRLGAKARPGRGAWRFDAGARLASEESPR